MYLNIFQIIRDARRYRWLRQQHWSNSPIAVTDIRDIKFGGTTFSLDRLDDICDRGVKGQLKHLEPRTVRTQTLI